MTREIFLLLFILSSGIANSQGLKIATNFESGSARVLFVDQQNQTIRITPAGDSKRGNTTGGI